MSDHLYANNRIGKYLLLNKFIRIVIDLSPSDGKFLYSANTIGEIFVEKSNFYIVHRGSGPHAIVIMYLKMSASYLSFKSLTHYNN